MKKVNKAFRIAVLAFVAASVGFAFQASGAEWAVWDSENGIPVDMLIPLVLLFIVFSARVMAIGENGKVVSSDWAAYCVFALMVVFLLFGVAWVVAHESWSA